MHGCYKLYPFMYHFLLSRGFFFHISSLIHVNEFILTCSIIHTGSMLSSQRLNKVMAEVSWQIFIWVLLIKSNPSCILPCDWSRKFVPSFPPIRCKSKTKLQQSIAFPAFEQFGYFSFELLLVYNADIQFLFFFFIWPFWLVLFEHNE